LDITGLIVPIGAWVLEEACRYAKYLLDVGSGTGVAVNVSSIQFGHPDFIATVTGALERTGFPPFLLEPELTETVIMQDVEGVVSRIGELRSMGVTISIDDFGTGYSSLSYL
jgi:EAL domain-containing protein (putative c-di-GMP-specific phosphodiesterase class I)